MAAINLESRMHWLQIEPGYKDDTRAFFEKNVEEEAEMQGVWIGQWYYYLCLHHQQIDLCRNMGNRALSSPPEVMKPGQLAISDDDLECAVRYQSCGTFEPGYYRISPLIERKLRILFE